jgi:hypothetical protein
VGHLIGKRLANLNGLEHLLSAALVLLLAVGFAAPSGTPARGSRIV